MELKILERWTQHVQPPEDDEWFLKWVLSAPRQSSRHVTAGWHAYSALKTVHPEMPWVAEYFGGIGAQSLIIRELWHPGVHFVNELSSEAVNHIEENVPGVRACPVDSYAEPALNVDLVGLDFGDLTAWKTREGTEHRSLLDRVFAQEPKGVVLTDIACRYLHLHRDRYEILLGWGTCGTYLDYLGALTARLEELYGYRMVGGFYDRWSTVMALSRTGEAVPFVPTPGTPIGLEIVE